MPRVPGDATQAAGLGRSAPVSPGEEGGESEESWESEGESEEGEESEGGSEEGEGEGEEGEEGGEAIDLCSD
jgi:hypothetical protein